MKQIRNPYAHLVIAGILSFVNAIGSQTSWADRQAFEFDSASKKVTVTILNELSGNHYQKLALNDSFSEELLDHYLGSLDATKTIFLQSDVDEFARYRTQLDDQLKDGTLLAPQEIYARFHERSVALIRYTLANLEKYAGGYGSDKAELALDRKNASWPASLQESQELWDKRIFNEVLLIRLSNKENKESITDTLRKRYTTRLNRMEAIKADDAFDMFINSALDFYDPHTEWLSPKSEENFKINMSLSLEGIGAVLQQEEEKTKIMRLVTGGPAAKSGALQPGDFILAIGQGTNGEMEDVSGQRLDEVVQKIRGPKGSIVRLQIESGTNQILKTVTLERDQVKLEDQAAKSAVLDYAGKKIGIINIPAFYMDFEAYRRGDENYRSTTRDVQNLLVELMAKKIDGIVIDLRNNGGGSLQEARLLTNLFVSQGPIVQIRSSNNQIDRSLRAEQDAVYYGPLLVLTNHLSASASEIFAGAIQDYERGIVLGEQTFGKGTVQTISELDYGQLKYTNGKFYRVSGESTQHRGIVPDIITPSLYDFEEVGESSLEHALPWDSIHEISHLHYNEIKPFISELNARHQKRMNTSPDYKFLLERITYRNEKKNIKFLSLNEKVRRQQQDEDNARMLRITNQMRKQKQLVEFKTIEDLEKYEEEQASKWNGATVIDLENDFLLQESAAVLLDFIELKLKKDGSSFVVIKSANKN